MPPKSNRVDGGPGATLRAALVYQQSGHLQEALRLYDSLLETDAEDAEVLNFAGAAYVQSGNLARGIALLRQATALRPDYAEAHRNLGIALRKAGQLEAAAAAHRRVLELFPRYAEGYNDLGIVLRRLGRLEDAAAAYAQALELNPDYTEAHVNLGNVLMRREKVAEARASYERALALDPRNAGVHRRLGIALQMQDKTEEAIASYQRAITIDPTDSLAHADFGAVLAQKGDAKQAVEYLRRAVRLNPQTANAYASLGIALHDLGQLEEALEAYDRCLALDPGNSHALAYKIITLNDLGEHSAVRQLADFDRLIRVAEIAVPNGYADLGAFNAALAQYACMHPTLAQGRPNNTTRKGGQTGELFIVSQGPVAALKQMVYGAVKGYIEELAVEPGHPMRAKLPGHVQLTGWATVLDAGGYQDPHVHPYSWLSGVYYPKVPHVISASRGGHAGWIEFGCPDGRHYRRSGYEVRLFRPTEGLLLLFPSYFWHRTIPYDGNEQRISYAFDVLPEQ